MLNQKIQESIKQSVLCWLATSSAENIPNVSPKELFINYDEETILIANIASPQSERNIRANNQVCLSFVDILVQKGYQLHATATIITKEHNLWSEYYGILHKLTCGDFPMKNIFELKVHKAKPIIAPSYLLFPETKESDQIKAAIKTYKLKE